MRSYLAKYADDINDNALSPVTGYHEINPDDFVKFDRINLFDFRRTLPQKERESNIDSKGRGWGYGKRKNATAQVFVQAGNGKITVNTKPIL